MCGRFQLFSPSSVIIEHFELEEENTSIFRKEYYQNYNVSPGTKIWAVFNHKNVRMIGKFQWQFIPYWTKNIKKTPYLINARLETIDQKPSFKKSFEGRRCIIPANGFYEWMKLSGKKLPHRIYSSVSPILGFGGIWDEWKNEKGETIQSVAIITKEAFGRIARIHNRQPAIIREKDYSIFLNSKNIDEIKGLIENTRFELDDVKVSSDVSNPRKNYPELINPIESDIN